MNIIASKYLNVVSLSALLSVYFTCRLIFQQFPVIKQAFIYPSGILVSAFFSAGKYIESEWVYFFGNTRFVLDESCSGTTFFSLLLAYLIYTKLQYKVSSVWLVLAYPITLVVNSIRVLSSMYAHHFLSIVSVQRYNDHIHVMTGTVTFLTSLLLIALVIEKKRAKYNNEK